MENTPTIQLKLLTPSLASDIDDIILAHKCDTSKLVGILLEVQKILPRQYIPMEVAAYVGEKMNLPLSRIYDVISFYEALSSDPRADYVIQICDSVVCKVTGSDQLSHYLNEILQLSVGEISSDYKFSLVKSPCFGACDCAPALRINGTVHGNLTSVEKVRHVLSTCF